MSWAAFRARIAATRGARRPAGAEAEEATPLAGIEAEAGSDTITEIMITTVTTTTIMMEMEAIMEETVEAMTMEEAVATMVVEEEEAGEVTAEEEVEDILEAETVEEAGVAETPVAGAVEIKLSNKQEFICELKVMFYFYTNLHMSLHKCRVICFSRSLDLSRFSLF